MPVLRGRGVTVRPLSIADASALFSVTHPETFLYFIQAPKAWTLDAFREFIGAAIADSMRRPFVVELPGGELAGSSSYLDLRPAHRGLEIGFTWYAPAHRGTSVNPETKLLLLEHAFGPLGCERVQLKCDARNVHSQRAIAKLGAVREGVLRKHMVMPDGYMRDTVMFSITRGEWPQVRANLHARLGYAASA